MQYSGSFKGRVSAISALSAVVLAGAFSADPAFAQSTGSLDSWASEFDTYWKSAKSWIQKEFAEAPALVIAGGVAVFVPLLAILGLVLRRLFSHRPRRFDTIPLTKPPRAWQVRARLEVINPVDDREQFDIGHGLVRIGREEDNDVQLVHKTVHRYHAVIERTPESEFVITDVSGADGNGVRVNGELVQRQRLRGGEMIDIGRAQLKFALSES